MEMNLFNFRAIPFLSLGYPRSPLPKIAKMSLGGGSKNVWPPKKCHEEGGQRVWPTKNLTRGCFLAPTKMSWGGPLTTHQKCPRGVLFGENLANKTTVSRWRLHAGPPFCLFWSTSAASGTYNIHRIWVIYCSFYLNIIKYSYWYNNLALKLNKTE